MVSAVQPSTPLLTSLQILIEARSLILNERNWTQNTRARDKKARHIPPLSPHAKRFSEEGAIRRAGGVGPDNVMACHEASSILDAASHALFRISASHVNDSRGHRSILAAFDFAIETFSKPYPKI